MTDRFDRWGSSVKRQPGYAGLTKNVTKKPLLAEK